MSDLMAVVEVLLAGSFLLLAVVAVVRAPRTGPSGWWAAAAFGALGVALIAAWLPGWLGIELPRQTDGVQLLLALGHPSGSELPQQRGDLKMQPGPASLAGCHDRGVVHETRTAARGLSYFGEIGLVLSGSSSLNRKEG